MTEAQERAVVADKKLLLCAICQALAPSLLKRMQCVAPDFAQQHQGDPKQADKGREGDTLLLAMRR